MAAAPCPAMFMCTMVVGAGEGEGAGWEKVGVLVVGCGICEMAGPNKAQTSRTVVPLIRITLPRPASESPCS